MPGKSLTAYCGLYCGDCIRYKSKASDLANELLIEIEKTHLTEYAEVKKHHTKEFSNFGSMVSLLEALKNIKCETPCRMGGDGCGGNCKIIACVKAKSFEGCWECNVFESCEKLDFLKPFHGDSIINNLKTIKAHGIDTWAKFREKCYPWM
jgi:hypothetical protein